MARIRSLFSVSHRENKNDSIWGPYETRNEQLEQNPSSKVSKVSVKMFRSSKRKREGEGGGRGRGRRRKSEKEDREEENVSLPRLKTGYGNKSEAGRKGKIDQVSSRCTYAPYVGIIIGVPKERHGCTCAK